MLVLALVAASVASSDTPEPIWVGSGQAEGFALWHGGYKTDDYQAATVARLGLTLPDNGYTVIYGTGTIEVKIEGFGWVRDDGLQVMDQCGRAGWGSLDKSSVVNITAADRCKERGDRVIIYMTLPWRKFLTAGNPITDVRFPGNYWRFGNDEEDPDNLPAAGHDDDRYGHNGGR